MYLFARMIATDGDMEALMPLVQEISAIVKNEAHADANIWSGSNGFVAGTLIFTIAYESMAARAQVTSKLAASKAWWAANRKMREHITSIEPDTIYRYLRGGSIGSDIPLGTIVSQNQFQLAQGADWIAALKWANDYSELSKKITGIEINMLHSLYGKLGELSMLTGLPNAAAIDEHRAKLMANPEFMPKFLEGNQFALAGSVLQRHLVKIA